MDVGPGSTGGRGWGPTTLFSPACPVCLLLSLVPVLQVIVHELSSGPLPSSSLSTPLVYSCHKRHFLMKSLIFFSSNAQYCTLCPVLSISHAPQHLQCSSPTAIPYILLKKKKKIQRHSCLITFIGTEVQIPKKLWPHTKILRCPKRKEEQVLS